MAERWGIGDDFERERAVDEASDLDLEALVHCIDHIGDEDLVGWLSGPEADNPRPSAEYLAIICLTMARFSALAKLRRRAKRTR